MLLESQLIDFSIQMPGEFQSETTGFDMPDGIVIQDEAYCVTRESLSAWHRVTITPDEATGRSEFDLQLIEDSGFKLQTFEIDGVPCDIARRADGVELDGSTVLCYYNGTHIVSMSATDIWEDDFDKWVSTAQFGPAS